MITLLSHDFKFNGIKTYCTVVYFRWDTDNKENNDFPQLHNTGWVMCFTRRHTDQTLSLVFFLLWLIIFGILGSERSSCFTVTGNTSCLLCLGGSCRSNHRTENKWNKWRGVRESLIQIWLMFTLKTGGKYPSWFPESRVLLFEYTTVQAKQQTLMEKQNIVSQLVDVVYLTASAPNDVTTHKLIQRNNQSKIGNNDLKKVLYHGQWTHSFFI